MGIPGEFSHPDFIIAMDRIKSVAKNMNVTGGIHIIEPDIVQLKNRIKEGYDFIAYSLDIRMLDTICRDALQALRISK
jgi:2-dehydro-3-deoxyglucarate aldolase